MVHGYSYCSVRAIKYQVLVLVDINGSVQPSRSDADDRDGHCMTRKQWYEEGQAPCLHSGILAYRKPAGQIGLYMDD